MQPTHGYRPIVPFVPYPIQQQMHLKAPSYSYYATPLIPALYTTQKSVYIPLVPSYHTENIDVSSTTPIYSDDVTQKKETPKNDVRQKGDCTSTTEAPPYSAVYDVFFSTTTATSVYSETLKPHEEVDIPIFSSEDKNSPSTFNEPAKTSTESPPTVHIIETPKVSSYQAQLTALDRYDVPFTELDPFWIAPYSGTTSNKRSMAPNNSDDLNDTLLKQSISIDQPQTTIVSNEGNILYATLFYPSKILAANVPQGFTKFRPNPFLVQQLYIF